MANKILDYCTQLAAFSRGQPSIYALICEHGQPFVAAPCPPEFQGGTPKFCFHNAVALIKGNPSLTYCEGIAVSAGLEIPMHHGWCIDPDGRVVDPTWDRPADCEYYGIAFQRDFVLGMYKRTSIASVLDNWEDRSVFTSPPSTFLINRPHLGLNSGLEQSQ